MKPEDVYALAPEVIDEEMLDSSRTNIEALLGFEPKLEQTVDLAELLLEVAQRYYRLGAFEMEHKDGARCEAEDQGGWPCCKSAAEFFVLAKHLPKITDKRPVYCAMHRTHNRFFRADQMAAIYEKPVQPETATTGRCIGCGETKEICCNNSKPFGGQHVDPRCAACCNHKEETDG